MIRFHTFRFTIRPGNLNFLLSGQFPGAFQHFHLVFFQQELNPLAHPFRYPAAPFDDGFEIRFGLTTHEVMANLCRRVPIPDLRFFAITLALNKETGGNLTEIFDKIGRLVRERQVFRRQVEALTAEGRYSAIVLILLPVAMFIYVYVTNYDYLSILWTDPTGRIMLAGGVIGMIFGYFVMRRMVQLEV